MARQTDTPRQQPVVPVRRAVKVPARCPMKECGSTYAIEGRRIIHTYADGTQEAVGTMCVCAMCGTTYLSTTEGTAEPRAWFGIIDPPKPSELQRERDEERGAGRRRERDDEIPSSIDDHRWRR